MSLGRTLPVGQHSSRVCPDVGLKVDRPPASSVCDQSSVVHLHIFGVFGLSLSYPAASLSWGAALGPGGVIFLFSRSEGLLQVRTLQVHRDVPASVFWFCCKVGITKPRPLLAQQTFTDNWTRQQYLITVWCWQSTSTFRPDSGGKEVSFLLMWRKGVRCQRAELAFRPISSVLSFDPQVKLPIMGVKDEIS